LFSKKEDEDENKVPKGFEKFFKRKQSQQPADHKEKQAAKDDN